MSPVPISVSNYYNLNQQQQKGNNEVIRSRSPVSPPPPSQEDQQGLLPPLLFPPPPPPPSVKPQSSNKRNKRNSSSKSSFMMQMSMSRMPTPLPLPSFMMEDPHNNGGGGGIPPMWMGWSPFHTRLGGIPREIFKGNNGDRIIMEIGESSSSKPSGLVAEMLRRGELEDRDVIVLGSTFVDVRKIGAGAFGELYQGYNVELDQMVAMKLEPTIGQHPTLEKEYKFLQILRHVEGVPKVIGFGSESTNRILMLELLGRNLQELLEISGGTFSLKTTYMVAIQLLSRLENVHYRNVVHRDIKPANICIGRGENQPILYLIDYGLSKLFRHEETLEHVPSKVNKNIVGTTRFASLRCHQGEEISRRDDLESLAYTLIYCLKGKLPWQGLKSASHSKKEYLMKIRDIKMTTPVATLCEGLPSEFMRLLIYSRNLRFDECPDYSYLKNMFTHAMKNAGYSYDYHFDWVEDLTWDAAAAEIQKTQASRKANQRGFRQTPKARYITPITRPSRATINRYTPDLIQFNPPYPQGAPLSSTQAQQENQYFEFENQIFSGPIPFPAYDQNIWAPVPPPWPVPFANLHKSIQSGIGTSGGTGNASNNPNAIQNQVNPCYCGGEEIPCYICSSMAAITAAAGGYNWI